MIEVSEKEVKVGITRRN